MNIGSRFVFVAVVMAISISALPAGAADTEAASVSKLTGTSFGATPERDLRPIAISTCTDYLDQGAKLSDPTAKISDVEVIFWRGAVTTQAVAAYQKLVTDNLTQGGYTYRAIDPQTANGVTTTRFEAVSAQGANYWLLANLVAGDVHELGTCLRRGCAAKSASGKGRRAAGCFGSRRRRQRCRDR
jgi:hypothetical protein